MIELLFTVLTAGAKLAASNAVTEFAKGAGKAAFDGIKARLTGTHGVKSLGLLEDASENPAYAAAVKADLSKPDIAADPTLLELAQTLKDAIAALPDDVKTRYAINVEVIDAGGKLLIDTAEGIKAKTVKSVGDMTLTNITAPPGN